MERHPCIKRDLCVPKENFQYMYILATFNILYALNIEHSLLTGYSFANQIYEHSSSSLHCSPSFLALELRPHFHVHNSVVKATTMNIDENRTVRTFFFLQRPVIKESGLIYLGRGRVVHESNIALCHFPKRNIVYLVHSQNVVLLNEQI